jgi:hypothetical protein
MYPIGLTDIALKTTDSTDTKYIRWSDLSRRLFGIETVCPKCQTPLRLISLIRSEDIARKILVAMHLPTDLPEHHPARPRPGRAAEEADRKNWPN